MPIKFECPGCHKKLTVADAMAGKRGKCPACQNQINVPANGATPPPSSPPAPAAPSKPAAASKPAGPAAAPAPAAKAAPASKPAAKSSPAPSSKSTAATTPPAAPKPARPAPAKPTAATATKDKPAASAPPTMINQAALAPPPPPEDAEAAAAAAFADDQAEEQEVTQIEFECEWCGHKNVVPASEATKRVSCQSEDCRRIVKVPDLPKKDKDKQNWRAMKTREGHKQTEPVPDNVMGGASSSVSREALEEADALPARKEPVKWSQRVFRLVALGAVLGLVAWSGLGIYHWWVGRSEDRALLAVRTALDGKDLPDDRKAVLREFLMLREVRAGHATAERIDKTGFFERIGLWSSKKKGPKVAATQDGADREFKLILGLLSGDQSGNEDRDFLLMDLALIQIDLAGTKDQVEAGGRIKWDDAQRSAGAALKAIHSHDVKLEGLRQVTRRLIARKESKRADALTNQVFLAEDEQRVDARARIALELFQAGEIELVKTIADQVLPLYARDKPAPAAKVVPPPGDDEMPPAEREVPPMAEKPPAVTSAVIALAVVLKRKPPPVEEDILSKQIELLGKVEGLGRQGKFEEARTKLTDLNGYPPAKLRGLVALAACAADAGSRDPNVLDDAISLIGGQNAAKVRWEAYRIAEMGVRAGLPAEKLQPLASSLASPALRGRVQLALFRAELGRSSRALQDSALDAIDRDSLSKDVARILLAEHNTRHGGAKTVASWNERDKPFGQMGIALGLQRQK